jgi:hypothetical protein
MNNDAISISYMVKTYPIQLVLNKFRPNAPAMTLNPSPESLISLDNKSWRFARASWSLRNSRRIACWRAQAGHSGSASGKHLSQLIQSAIENANTERRTAPIIPLVIAVPAHEMNARQV